MFGIGCPRNPEQRDEIFLSKVLSFCADVAEMKDTIFSVLRAAAVCLGVFLGRII
jgi:hypothetical protein